MIENVEELLGKVSDKPNPMNKGSFLIMVNGDDVKVEDNLNVSNDYLANILLRIASVKVDFAMAMDEAMTKFMSIESSERFKNLINEYGNAELSIEEIHRIKHLLFEELRKAWFNKLK